MLCLCFGSRIRDHDFKEISWVWGEKEKHIWETKDTGAEVGRLSTQGLREAFESWSDDLGFDVDDIAQNPSIKRRTILLSIL